MKNVLHLRRGNIITEDKPTFKPHRKLRCRKKTLLYPAVSIHKIPAAPRNKPEC